jgi:S-adenosylmethionine-diacylgycerolhomoserine-N-methlytransferase
MRDAEALERMERMYRPQIGLYDLTRKPYLLGRDRLIATMPLAPGDLVCEVGCGTGRNLERLARREPTLRLFGLDASAAMLERARQRRCASLARGLAEELNPKTHFGIEQPFDRIVFSYALSMIADWRGALRQSLKVLRPGGTLAIVDFGDQRRWPGPMKRGLRAWLRLFDVNPVDDLRWHLETKAAAGAGRLQASTIGGGYAQLITFEKA